MSFGKYCCWDLKGKKSCRRLISALLAECIGVAVVMIVGCSAVAPNLQLSLLYAATAFGFAMSIALMAVAHISGGHVNPAVTVAALILGKLSPISAILYVLSQCIGGLIGMQAVLFMQPDNLSSEFCVTQLGPGVDPLKGVAVEAIFTSILALLACSSFDHRNSNKLDSSPIRFGIAIIALTIICQIYSHFINFSFHFIRLRSYF